MGAMGWSWGGYAMMWLEGHTTRFKALASMMGVYDLRAMYSSTEELWFPEWDLKGAPWENPALYRKQSPSEFVKALQDAVPRHHGREGLPRSLHAVAGVLHGPPGARRAVAPRSSSRRRATGRARSRWRLYYAAHLDWFHRYLGGAAVAVEARRPRRRDAEEKRRRCSRRRLPAPRDVNRLTRALAARAPPVPRPHRVESHDRRPALGRGRPLRRRSVGTGRAHPRGARRSPRAFRTRPTRRGLLAARTAVSNYYAAVHGVLAPPDQIVLTASSSEAYGWLFKLLGRPRRRRPRAGAVLPAPRRPRRARMPRAAPLPARLRRRLRVPRGGRRGGGAARRGRRASRRRRRRRESEQPDGHVAGAGGALGAPRAREGARVRRHLRRGLPRLPLLGPARRRARGRGAGLTARGRTGSARLLARRTVEVGGPAAD